MPTTASRTNAGALLSATAAQAALANSVIHQFKINNTPNPNWTLAQFQAAECAYDGYAPITLVAWGAPVLAPGSGWMTIGPQVTFRWTFATGVTDAVGGYWVETAGGVVTDYVIYNQMVAMGGPGASDTQTPVEVYPANPVSN